MKTFEFSIIASGPDPKAEDFESRFYDAGCDDATVSFQRGHVIIDFAREAVSLDEAIASAIADVRAAGAVVDRVEPDPLVSLSEIAHRTKLSRAAVSLYAKEQRGAGFPPPAVRVTSESPLYQWDAVAAWMHRRGTLQEEQVVEAAIIRSANEHLHLDDVALRERLRAIVRQQKISA
jgi:predicted DNA-binding transcriptional regulator AlpA